MKRWVYAPSPALQRTFRERLTVFPREPDMTVYGLRLGGMVALKLVMAGYFRLRIIGRELIPAQGPFVLVANHSSHLDAVALSCALPPRLWCHAYAVAAQDYFFRSFVRALAAVVSANAMPFDRKEDPQKSLELCAEALQVSGEGLIIFPEGTRSLDGSIGRFRLGVGRLVAGTEIPVVPAYIHGAHYAWPKGGVFPKPTRVTVVIGSPRVYPKAPRTQEGFIAVADDARQAVLELQGQLVSGTDSRRG